MDLSTSMRLVDLFLFDGLESRPMNHFFLGSAPQAGFVRRSLPENISSISLLIWVRFFRPEQKLYANTDIDMRGDFV
jgi:hypothetical protein